MRIVKTREQISIRHSTWEKLQVGLPRDHNGHIRRGALKDRVDQIIARALDKEQAQ